MGAKLEAVLEKFVEYGLASVLWAGLGIVLFIATYWVFSKMFPMKKEIEDDQNTALAILMGSVMLGIAIILAAAIHG